MPFRMKPRPIAIHQPRAIILNAFMIAILAATTFEVVAATGDVISAQLGILGGVTSDDLGGVVTNQPLVAADLPALFRPRIGTPLRLHYLATGLVGPNRVSP